MAENDPTPLTVYLSQAYLPPLIIEDSVPPVEEYSNSWPQMEELSCGPGFSRGLKKVAEVPMAAIENLVRTYFAGFENRIKFDWNNACLTMPCPGITTLGILALTRSIIESEGDYTHAIQHFMLGTAAEAIRTLEGQPFDDDELKFVRFRLQSVINRGRKICTLYTFGDPMPPTGNLRPGIVIFSLPPWKFGCGDFKDFTSRRAFAPGEFDRETPDTEAWSNGTKLWTVVHDSCKVSGFRWFVVTTYSQWAFGTWSLDWTAAAVTPTIPFDRTRGMTLLELLVFWTQSARDKVRYWQIAPNAED